MDNNNLPQPPANNPNPVSIPEAPVQQPAIPQAPPEPMPIVDVAASEGGGKKMIIYP